MQIKKKENRKQKQIIFTLIKLIIEEKNNKNIYIKYRK